MISVALYLKLVSLSDLILASIWFVFHFQKRAWEAMAAADVSRCATRCHSERTASLHKWQQLKWETTEKCSSHLNCINGCISCSVIFKGTMSRPLPALIHNRFASEAECKQLAIGPRLRVRLRWVRGPTRLKLNSGECSKYNTIGPDSEGEHNSCSCGFTDDKEFSLMYETCHFAHKYSDHSSWVLLISSSRRVS